MPPAREAEQTVELVTRRASKFRRLLFFSAGFLGLLCAGVAFLVLVVRDRGHSRIMVHDQSASSFKAPAAAKDSTPKSKSPAVTTGDAGDKAAATRNSFRMEVGRKPLNLGPIRVRLSRVDVRRGLYDISVLSGRRSFSHRRLRLNSPVWIALAKGQGALEIVVTSIEKRAVEGYWIQSEHSPEVTATTPKH